MTTYTASQLFSTTVAGDGALTVDEITDSSAAGRALLKAADVNAQVTALGLADEVAAVANISTNLAANLTAANAYTDGKVAVLNGQIAVAQTAAQTAAKTYADATFLNLAGGETMTGMFNLSGDPTANTHPSTKHYVDINLILRKTRTEIKALNTTDVQFVYCNEVGREGFFTWKAGDYSAQIIGDTAEGLYLKADAIAATAGAWVRIYSGDADLRWFGYNGADLAPTIDAMISAGIRSIKLAANTTYQLPNGYSKSGINNVTIESSGGYGSANLVVGGNNHGFTLTNCSFWRFDRVSINRASGSLAGDGIRFEGNSSSNKITGCYISGHKGRAIAFLGTSSVQQTGNDCTDNIIIDNEGGGIFYFWSNDFKIVEPEIGRVSSATYPAFGIKLDHANQGQIIDSMMWDNVQDINMDTCMGVRIVAGRIEESRREGIYGTGCTFILIEGLDIHTHSKESNSTYDYVKFVSSTAINIVGCDFYSWNASTGLACINLDTATGNTSRIVANMFHGYSTTPYNLNSATGCIVAANDPIDAFRTIGTRTRVAAATDTIQTPGALTDIASDISNPNTGSWAGIQQTFRVGAGATRVARLAQRAGTGSGGQDVTQTANSSGTLVTAKVIDQNQNWVPGTDNVQNIGSASLRMATIYAGTGTINTSDREAKANIRALSEAEKRVAAACKGLIRAFQFKDAVADKGDAARVHFGVIAQDVIAAFGAEGLDANRYGIVCFDKWDEHEEVRNEETGDIIIPHRSAGQRYGVRYEELLAFIIGAL